MATRAAGRVRNVRLTDIAEQVSIHKSARLRRTAMILLAGLIPSRA